MGLAVARATHTISNVMRHPVSASIGGLAAGAAATTGLTVAYKQTYDKDFPRADPVPPKEEDPGTFGALFTSVATAGLGACLIHRGHIPAGLAMAGAGAGVILSAFLLNGMAEKAIAARTH